MKTLVIGLGNPILTDDGVGVNVAFEVEKAVLAAARDDIEVIEASAGGLRLIELMIGYDRLVLIDAYSAASGRQPGRIHRLTFDDLRNISPTQHSISAHDTTFGTELEIGRTIGLKLPTEISIYAIEVENLYEFGDEPTPAVAAAIPEAAAAELSELHLN